MHSGLSQSCDLLLSGIVIDKVSKTPIEFAEVIISESRKGCLTDSNGHFSIESVCPGSIHVRVSHIAYEPFEYFLSIEYDTVMFLNLIKRAQFLDEIHIHGNRQGNTSQIYSSLDEDLIKMEGNQNLADLLGQVEGVRVLRTGNGISKPIIHGLSGNRIGIVNNGVLQAGQQWGGDHAPEIDPFAAAHIAVVQGAGSLEYGGNTLGSIVVISPGQIRDDPHLHGTINYGLITNGWGHVANTKLSKAMTWGRLRLTATLKRFGDQRSRNYFLTNTGQRENNVAIQWQKSISKKWNTEFYYSFFNTTIGILRGSHIGNLTDLQEAIGRDIPFFTQSNFSYDIEAPSQRVNHHLAQIEFRYTLSDQQQFKLKYSGQLNLRKEFDVRRGGRTDRPALSMEQYQHTIDFSHQYASDQVDLIKSGIQFSGILNTNNPETGVRPLIPDYQTFHMGSYIILNDHVGKVTYELGGRYDFRQHDVRTITKTLPAAIERFKHVFHQVSLMSGLQWVISNTWNSKLNVSYFVRNPEINELYSSGLHQGVSGIEEGSRDLIAEQALKIILSQHINIHDHINLSTTIYYQNINNYIYLQPQEEFRLTVRGAFPVFLYQQTNAAIKGMDLSANIQFSDRLAGNLVYNLIRGKDKENDIPLFQIPADQIRSILTYKISDQPIFKETFLALEGNYVARQNRIGDGQDFLPPPDDFFLLALELKTKLIGKKNDLQISIKGENLLNAAYRDYLDRNRYFADGVGINFRVAISYTW
jgi:iron complex outermembrane receptor protein